ncbi:MAG: YoaK family protein, partial [Acidimicrobiales bacterium]
MASLSSAQSVARALTAAGGYVDAVGYVALFRLFTAHQSGNSDGLGVALGAGDWTEVWRRSISIAAFVAGIVIGSALVEVARQRQARSPAVGVALAEAAMLCLALGVGQAAATGGKIAPANTAAYATAAAALAGAMGLQAVAMRRAGNRTLWTTFMTGVLINMAQSLVVACFT